MPRSWVVLLAGASLMLASCDAGDSGGAGAGGSASQASASVMAVPSADPSATEDAPGTLACGALAAAINDGTLMNPGIVEAVVAASGTADAPIADAARRLSAAYAAATAATGTDQEPDAVAEVSAVAADMSNVCGESGLDTVG